MGDAGNSVCLHNPADKWLFLKRAGIAFRVNVESGVCFGLFCAKVLLLTILILIAPQCGASKAVDIMDTSPENIDLLSLNGSGVVIALAIQE